MNREFTCETDYDGRTLSAMAKALRKTIRKKQSRRAHIFGWTVAVLGILVNVAGGVNPVTLTALVILIPVLLFEDRLNGYLTKRRLLPGNEHCSSHFYPDHFLAVTGIGKTEFRYDRIQCVTEDENYFVFVIGKNRTQAYDKRKLSGGTAAEFRSVLEEKTGRKVTAV